MMRSYCYKCKRAICLCSEVKQINNRIEVIILQHRDEFKNPKNTANLLHLSLKNSKLIVGKSFEKELKEILNHKKYALVFPDNNEFTTHKPIASELNHSKIDGIILLDGTWKKAKKIYYKHPELQTLPKIDIKNHKSEYIIRKSPNENALSTFEAGLFVLEKLNEAKIDLLKPLFKTFIKMSLSNYKENKRNVL